MDNASFIKSSLASMISNNSSVEVIKAQLGVMSNVETINSAMVDIIAELAGVNDPRARLIVETAKALIQAPQAPQAWWEQVKAPTPAKVIPDLDNPDLDNPVVSVVNEVVEEQVWSRADERGSFRVIHRLDDKGLNALLQELHHGRWETLMTSRQYGIRSTLLNMWTRAKTVFKTASQPSLFTATLGTKKFEFLFVPKTRRIVFARPNGPGKYTFGRQVITERQAEFFRHTLELFMSIDKCSSTI